MVRRVHFTDGVGDDHAFGTTEPRRSMSPIHDGLPHRDFASKRRAILDCIT